MPPIISKKPDKSEAQLHYESLSSFLKYAIGISGTLISVIIAVALWFSYGNVNEMKQGMKDDMKDVKSNYEATAKDLKDQIKELKDDAKETVSQIRDDSKQTVESTKRYSEQELSRISVATNQAAMTETRRQLSDIFASDKIQSMIQNQAVAEIKDKVVDIVSEQARNLSDISDAGAEMRAGKLSGVTRLQAFIKNPKNELERMSAKQLYDLICQDYVNQVNISDTKNERLGFDSTGLIDLTDDKMLTNIHSIRALKLAMENINVKDYDLFSSAYYTIVLGKLTKHDFKVFDFDGMNRWHSLLKK